MFANGVWSGETIALTDSLLGLSIKLLFIPDAIAIYRALPAI